MAILLGRKFPIDTQPAKAVGVAIPFNNAAVFTSNYTTSKQLQSNLINFFLTNRGERVLDPTYGANLRATIFEQKHRKILQLFRFGLRRVCSCTIFI